MFDALGKMASEYLSNATPQQAADAASDHVQSADPNETADHLTQSVPNMDSSSLMSLGQHLLQTYTQHSDVAGDANAATQAAGVSQDAVAAGDPGAISTMLQFAKNNPQILADGRERVHAAQPGRDRIARTGTVAGHHGSPRRRVAGANARVAIVKIVLFGASGMIGSRILTEALSRGHVVTAVVRSPDKIDARAEPLRGQGRCDRRGVRSPRRPPEAISRSVRTVRKPGRKTTSRRMRPRFLPGSPMLMCHA